MCAHKFKNAIVSTYSMPPPALTTVATSSGVQGVAQSTPHPQQQTATEREIEEEGVGEGDRGRGMLAAHITSWESVNFLIK